MQVQVLLPAPRQNKAARSCGGTSTATSTGDLVFPFPSQTHSVGPCDGVGSDLTFPFSGAAPPARVNPLRSNAKGVAKSFFAFRHHITIIDIFEQIITGKEQKQPVPALSGTGCFCCIQRRTIPRISFPSAFARRTSLSIRLRLERPLCSTRMMLSKEERDLTASGADNRDREEV